MDNSIQPMEVNRDQDGSWTHHDYMRFCGAREFISATEFDVWTKSNNLEWAVDFPDETLSGCHMSEWQPEIPDGEGWFVGSIHDTEDGPVCVWLRHAAPTQKEQSND
ncbi:hypothetical protein [Hafnia alvei]|uniref:hypothetical protein n=1 Tax=Hafnia alvei TaxID=569 RepID=UPI00061CE713|nr:hypothetical protein [Hafnia alvei]KKF38478.1 prophage protein [Hafnia alvei]MBW3476437.1 hypothetical protein [Hafnia alvei]